MRSTFTNPPLIKLRLAPPKAGLYRSPVRGGPARGTSRLRRTGEQGATYSLPQTLHAAHPSYRSPAPFRFALHFTSTDQPAHCVVGDGFWKKYEHGTREDTRGMPTYGPSRGHSGPRYDTRFSVRSLAPRLVLEDRIRTPSSPNSDGPRPPTLASRQRLQSPNCCRHSKQGSTGGSRALPCVDSD